MKHVNENWQCHLKNNKSFAFPVCIDSFCQFCVYTVTFSLCKMRALRVSRIILLQCFQSFKCKYIIYDKYLSTNQSAHLRNKVCWYIIHDSLIYHGDLRIVSWFAFTSNYPLKNAFPTITSIKINQTYNIFLKNKYIYLTYVLNHIQI